MVRKMAQNGFLWLFLLCTVPVVFSQSASTGQIAGTIKDQSGALLPGARVIVKSDTGLTREATSDVNGNYVVPLLPPGTYQVEISLAGFKIHTLEGVVVRITEITVVDAELEVGELTDTVTVTAESPLLQTDTPTTGRVIEERQLRELPLATGNFTHILNLSPGVFASVPDNRNTGNNPQDISVNGARQFGNNLQLNGVDANQIGLNNAENIPIPAPETLQEFKVQTSLFDASQGRTGGGLIAAVTKSGTSEFHGSVYEFLRNEKLNANDFFFNKTGTPRPALKRHRFGGTWGGPVLLPGYNGREKGTFFFISYQGSRERNGADAEAGSTAVVLPPGLTNDRTREGLSRATGGTVLPEQIAPEALALLNARLPNGAFAIPSPQIPGATGTNFRPRSHPALEPTNLTSTSITSSRQPTRSAQRCFLTTKRPGWDSSRVLIR